MRTEDTDTDDERAHDRGGDGLDYFTIFDPETLLPCAAGKAVADPEELNADPKLRFNTLLRGAGLDPADVRVMRHKDNGASKGRSPYELWRDKRLAFLKYQSVQSVKSRKKLGCKYWASFVVNGFDETIFAGIFRARYVEPILHDLPKVQAEGEFDPAGTLDQYRLTLSHRLSDLIGRLVIDWGDAHIVWTQYAHKNDKAVLEIRAQQDGEPFPGFLNFIQPLSRIGQLPLGWIEALKSARGVYVLTCPRTKEQYVGSADGNDGFYGRWMQYFQNGHGGNVEMKSRDPSDYQVSILEVAGSADDHSAVLEMEGRWQRKLQSYEMGLNTGPAKT